MIGETASRISPATIRSIAYLTVNCQPRGSVVAQVINGRAPTCSTRRSPPRARSTSSSGPPPTRTRRAAGTRARIVGQASSKTSWSFLARETAHTDGERLVTEAEHLARVSPVVGARDGQRLQVHAVRDHAPATGDARGHAGGALVLAHADEGVGPAGADTLPDGREAAGRAGGRLERPSVRLGRRWRRRRFH